LDLGAHTLFIGEIKDIKADETILGDGDTPDIRAAELLSFDPPGRSYFSPGAAVAKAFFDGLKFR
jgi:flavin reductase (DIM6/NTAB) family NADH-FMN oxidoreductase RutF